MKTAPAWYEQKWPRTGTSRSQSLTDRIGVVGRRGLVLKILFQIHKRIAIHMEILFLFVCSDPSSNTIVPPFTASSRPDPKHSTK